jgi:hypothetical protein
MLQLTPEEQVLQALDCASAYGVKKTEWLSCFLCCYSFYSYSTYTHEEGVQLAISEANEAQGIS